MESTNKQVEEIEPHILKRYELLNKQGNFLLITFALFIFNVYEHFFIIYRNMSNYFICFIIILYQKLFKT